MPNAVKTANGHGNPHFFCEKTFFCPKRDFSEPALYLFALFLVQPKKLFPRINRRKEPFVHQFHIADFGTMVIYGAEIVILQMHADAVAPVKVRQGGDFFQGAAAATATVAFERHYILIERA